MRQILIRHSYRRRAKIRRPDHLGDLKIFDASFTGETFIAEYIQDLSRAIHTLSGAEPPQKQPSRELANRPDRNTSQIALVGW